MDINSFSWFLLYSICSCYNLCEAYSHVLIETSVDDPEVSRTEGRVGQTTNVVIGGTVADDSTNEWLALDKKVQMLDLIRLSFPFFVSLLILFLLDNILYFVFVFNLYSMSNNINHNCSQTSVTDIDFITL